ncbi:MAG: nucleotidyltransferase domain-containing protein [Oscillospiraceae bacterium]|nr:nucleotidyltransferase domain-containing protein [Oscillospiraceae bacterium]
MQYNLPDRVLKDIVNAADCAAVKKVVLFGSRAKGTHRERSDIDLAVSGGDFDQFYWMIQEHAWSLLHFDLVETESCTNRDLLAEIEREGVVLYEKI